MPKEIYDLIGVGIGPFNLGLATLASTTANLTSLFFEQKADFAWHPGLMLDGATLQVSFLADLVTPVDPTHPCSFLAYIKSIGRLYQFAIRDSHFISRKEYTKYCQWVASRLQNLRFGHRVETIAYDEQMACFRITTRTVLGVAQVHFARHVVLGVGSLPKVPSCIHQRDSRILHAANYCNQRGDILRSQRAAVIGAGQSAAEIFADLLQHKPDTLSLDWFTRSERFLPMEYGKLTLEMASPDYIDHFFGLPAATRQRVLSRQDLLVKGINLALIDHIYDLLYDRSIDGEPNDVRMAANCELIGTSTHATHVTLRFLQRETQQHFELDVDHVVLATGFQTHIPQCLEPLFSRICWDECTQYPINRDYSLRSQTLGKIFVQNAEAHTHGFTASDLSIGPYRNATILNSIAKRPVFALEEHIAFQSFAVPPGSRLLEGPAAAPIDYASLDEPGKILPFVPAVKCHE